MSRFAKARHESAGETWKFGTTINGTGRYTTKFLNSTGAGLTFEPEFVFYGALSDDAARLVQNMKIRQFLRAHKRLPPGNKVIN